EGEGLVQCDGERPLVGPVVDDVHRHDRGVDVRLLLAEQNEWLARLVRRAQLPVVAAPLVALAVRVVEQPVVGLDVVIRTARARHDRQSGGKGPGVADPARVVDQRQLLAVEPVGQQFHTMEEPAVRLGALAYPVHDAAPRRSLTMGLHATQLSSTAGPTGAVRTLSPASSRTRARAGTSPRPRRTRSPAGAAPA